MKKLVIVNFYKGESYLYEFKFKEINEEWSEEDYKNLIFNYLTLEVGFNPNEDNFSIVENILKVKL